jgi:hypothetical protein
MTTNFDEAIPLHVDSVSPVGFRDAQIVAKMESNKLEEETPINKKHMLGKPKKGVAQALDSVVPIEPLLSTSLDLPKKAPNGPLPDSTGGKKRLRVVAELGDEASHAPHIAITCS